MRNIFLTTATALVLGTVLLLQAEPEKGETVKVRLRLVDDGTGTDVAGIVRVFPAGSDKPLSLAGLADRLRGLGKSEVAAGWYVVPAGGAETVLPRGAVRMEALTGLETLRYRRDIDLTKGDGTEVVARLRFCFRPEDGKLVAGNPHLHLRNLTAEQADDYLRQLPAADGLKVLFISYLERHKDDELYITNRYPIGPLKEFDTTGVLVSNGEEHRHNFEGYGPGYGHVMFLGIGRLVKPVSLGPGITGGGNDDIALRGGIDDARKQGGTAIWCHNTFGFEAEPEALTGRLDAFNVFDGSRQGTYAERYYRLLNVGLRLPISTGTDWFLYDFARDYVRVPENLTVQGWLRGLREGRCVATNGPLLTLTVDGKEVGDVIRLDKPSTVRVEAKGVGRHDFEQLQLMRNGKVIEAKAAAQRDGGYAAQIVREVRIDEPTWFAVRIDAKSKNELDRPLYAHSSPVYVDLDGKRVFDVESARSLLRQLEEARDTIRKRGQFSTPQARDKVLALYEQAEKDVRERINERGR
jgi:hypothetical protein